MGQKTNQAIVDEKLAVLDKKLDGYEKILAKHRYLAGNVGFLRMPVSITN
jgi:glutathionyl-hydroquinone reductase